MTSNARPWFDGDAGPDAKRHAPATLRNRAPIVEVLRDVLPARGLALEIASGSGEHVIHFAETFPDLQWQPSDPDAAAIASIAAWVEASGLANLQPPVALDAAAAEWPVERADAVLCINMIHISPWRATEGLMAGAGRLLGAGAPLYLYGPFVREGVPTADSNLAFDRSLRERNPDWGLRAVADVEHAAARRGLELDRVVEMPANNLSLVFRAS